MTPEATHADREQLRVCEAARQAWNARVVVFMDRPEPVDQVLALTWGADAIYDITNAKMVKFNATVKKLP